MDGLKKFIARDISLDAVLVLVLTILGWTFTGGVLYSQVEDTRARVERLEQSNQEFKLEYAHDQASKQDWERQMIHDIRVLCGSRSDKLPCPPQ